MYQSQWHAMRSFTRDKSVTEQRLSRGIVRRIATYARPYRLDLVIFLTLTALSAVIAVAVPLLLQRIIDDGILPGDTAVVLWVAGVVAALALLGAALSVATRWFSARIGEGLIYDLRTEVYEHVQRQRDPVHPRRHRVHAGLGPLAGEGPGVGGHGWPSPQFHSHSGRASMVAHSRYPADAGAHIAARSP